MDNTSKVNLILALAGIAVLTPRVAGSEDWAAGVHVPDSGSVGTSGRHSRVCLS